MSLALLFVVTSLGAYRVWRFFAVDELPPLVAVRDKLDAAIARHHGQAWADGLACVWCSGSWAAFATVGAVWHFTSLPLPGLWFGAVATVVGLIGMNLDED